MPKAELPKRGRGEHFFEAVAAHLGSAYLRYSFTKGTDQEVGFLVEALALRPGMRVLDVGCGPGRHSLALAARGIEVVGVDISGPFVDLATEGAAAVAPGLATFERMDARTMDFDAEFDVAISLCQGAFGLVPDEEGEVLRRMVAAVRPGGRLALTAFSAYFQVRNLSETDDFDADRGVNRERTTVRSPDGAPADFDLWTSVFTPRELRHLAEAAGAGVEALWSVTPGAYGRNAPDIEHPEWLLVLRRP